MTQGAFWGASEKLKEGIKVKLTPYYTTKPFDVGEQTSIVESVIAMGFDGILMTPADAVGVTPVIKKALAAGIPTVGISTPPEIPPAITFAGPQNRESACLVAEYVFEYLGGKGNIVIVGGSVGHPLTALREGGFDDAMAKYPDIKLLSKQPANWIRSSGLEVMENLLQAFPSPQINAVLCANDEEALGAIEAIESAGRANEMVIGSFDGNEDYLKGIKEGRFLVTLFQDPWKQGFDGMTALIDYLEGKTIPPEITWMGLIADKSNADLILPWFEQMNKFYTIFGM
jgi:ribose transport system substrate-binding protein